MSAGTMFTTTPTANMTAEELLSGLGVDNPVEIALSEAARVYSGTDSESGRSVTVKLLTAELEELDLVRFEREQERLTWRSVFDHPHIVTVLRSGFTEAGLPYLVMDHVPGGSVADRLSGGHQYAWAETLRMGVDLCGAMETAHQERVLHRNVTPQNILLDSEGRALLNNVGLRALGGDQPLDRDALAHRPPETLASERRTAQSDIYSLASTLHELFSGNPPFIRTGDTELHEVADRIVLEPPPDLRLWGVPTPVARAIDRGLSKDPSQRFQTAREFGQALSDCQAQLDLPVTKMQITAQATPTMPRPLPTQQRPQTVRRKRLRNVVTSLAVLAGAIAFGPALAEAGRSYVGSLEFGGSEVAGSDESPDGTSASTGNTTVPVTSGQPAAATTVQPEAAESPTVSTRPAVTVATSEPELLAEPLPGRPEIVDDLPLLPAALPSYTEFKRVADANPTFVFEVPVEHVDLISIPGQVVSSVDNEAALANEAVSATIVSGSQIDPSQWEPDNFLDDIHALRVTPQDPCPELKREAFADGPFTGLLRAASCQGGELLIVDIVVTNPEKNMILFLGFQLTDERDFVALDNTLASFGLGDVTLLPKS